MNRVRIVAVTAVALGVAVFAGTKFQDSRGMVAVGDEAAPQPTANLSLTPQERAAADAESLIALADETRADQTRAGAEGAGMPRPLPSQPAPIGAVQSGDATNPSVPGDALVAGQAPAGAPRQAQSLAQASVLPGVGGDILAPETRDEGLAAAETNLIESLTQPPQPDPAPFATAQAEAQQLPVAPLDEELQAELSACAVWLVVTPSMGGMLDASVYAPCDRDAVVQFDHAGMKFDTRIGSDGQLVQMIPALTTEATVTLTFADGRQKSDTTVVTDLDSLERVALQWQSPASLLLHAYEFGAQYGEPGHIHAGNPLAPGVQGHGFLTVLGDPTIPNGHMAQVYSYPMGQSSRTGSVVLEIEAPVTDDSCGRAIEAQSFELQGDGVAQIRMISLDMPSCDGAGGFVVIPGVLPDIQIASLN